MRIETKEYYLETLERIDDLEERLEHVINVMINLDNKIRESYTSEDDLRLKEISGREVDFRRDVIKIKCENKDSEEFVFYIPVDYLDKTDNEIHALMDDSYKKYMQEKERLKAYKKERARKFYKQIVEEYPYLLDEK